MAWGHLCAHGARGHTLTPEGFPHSCCPLCVAQGLFGEQGMGQCGHEVYKPLW